MSAIVGEQRGGYRLAGKRVGSALFGLAPPQLLLVAIAVVAAVALPTSTRSSIGLIAGLAVAGMCAAMAFCPVGGQVAHEVVPVVAGYAMRKAAGRTRWAAPLPLLTGTGPSRDRRPPALPPGLSGLGLVAVPRPAWAAGSQPLAPVGLVRDRRAGTFTVVVTARGRQFSLLDPIGRHQRLANWATVLSQFGKEASPVTRLGWSLWSAPAPLADHLAWLDSQRIAPGPAGLPEGVEADYRRLVDQAAPMVCRHDLRLWVTVDLRRLARRHGHAQDASTTALAAARALAERCRAAGLVVSAPLSPVEIAEAMRVQADPSVVDVMARVNRGLAERAGLASVLDGVDVVHAAPLAMDERWDSVRVDGAWHRVFWVAQWPALTVEPGWLDPLLMAPPCVRTMAVAMAPVPMRASRRRINADAVAVEGQLHMRERHAFRVPVHLQQAHADVDQREAELQAGHCEYAYLALVSVTGRDAEELDEASYALLDQAAQCGVTELRPLYARQAAGWACTLPLGRVPDRQLMRGAAS
jgi:hypothetical protein